MQWYYFGFIFSEEKLDINGLAIQNSFHDEGQCSYSWIKTRGKDLNRLQSKFILWKLKISKHLWKFYYTYLEKR